MRWVRLCIGFMFKKFTTICIWLCCFVSCSSDEPGSEFVGTWRGTAAGLAVTVDVVQAFDSAGSTVLQGTLSTNNAQCFNNATMSGSVTKTSVTIGGAGAGSVSTSTVLQVTGEVMETQIIGTVQMTAVEAACTVNAAITLTKS
jgi:hypothetical protein